MSKNLRIAGVGSLICGLLPLTLYLPADALPRVVEDGIFFICFPGLMFALALTGGVHGGHTDEVPVLSALFTAIISFAAIMLVSTLLSWFRARRGERRRKGEAA